MSSIDKQLAQAIKNLDSISKRAAPRANAQALNRVAPRVVSRSSKEVAADVRLPQKVIRKRAKVVKARFNRPVAYINVRRSDIPAISIAEARTQIRRQKGQFLVDRERRNQQGQFSTRKYAGNTSIRVGRHVFPNAFLQQLKNGRWQIMYRLTDRRYPIEVAKIPIRNTMTKAYQGRAAALMKSDYPKELEAALANQLRLIIKRIK